MAVAVAILTGTPSPLKSQSPAFEKYTPENTAEKTLEACKKMLESPSTAEKYTPENTAEKTLEACEKVLELPMFCSQVESVKLYLGLDPSTVGSLVFTIESPSASLLNQGGFFYAANGRLRDGAVKEVKLSKAICSSSSEVHTCQGSLRPAVGEKLATTFNFEQEVLSILLRDNKLRDVCMGKLADERKLTDNGRLERQFCEFTPTASYPSVSGAGFFDPNGYGTSGDSLLHVAFEGLPTDKTIRGCTQLGNSYQEVFSLTSYDADKGDAEIYGTLSTDEQAVFTRQGLEYSYDLYRQLAGNSGSISSLSSALALLNRQITSSAAYTEIRGSNKNFDELKRKQKKKKQEQKIKNARNLPISRLLSIATTGRATTEKPAEVFQWLAFDPIGGGDVILAPACSAKSITKSSYGVLSCNAPNSSARACYPLTSTDPAGSAKGNACLEIRNGYTLATIRVEGAADGTYYVCNDGSLVTSEKLTVATDSLGAFGELQITDNSLAAQKVPGLAKGLLASLNTITLGTAQDCSGPVVQGSLK